MVFSIIVPVYNVEAYVTRCLDSIITQDFDSYEVIVVDDGSTDSSGKRCDEYKKKYNNVKVIHQKNQGVAAARNTGLNEAIGEWILFVDSDDWIAEGTFRKIAWQIEQEEADLYSFNAFKTTEEGKLTEKLLFCYENESIHFFNEERLFDYITNRFMMYQDGWEVCFRVFKREIIKKNGLRFLDNKKVFAEDYLFSFQYLMYTKKIKQMCHIGYYYRQRDTSTIHNVEKLSVLPRLYQWAKVAYETVNKQNMKFFIKNFHMIYFKLLNFHLQHMLSDILLTDLEPEMSTLYKNRLHRRFIKKLKKKKMVLQKEMGIVEWL